MFDNFRIPRALFLITIFFLLQFFSGCSPESGNPLAKNYHNTTARYNAYFIAKEKIKEVEGIIHKNNVDDFNKILSVFPILKVEDTAQIKEPAEECIKMASLAIQRHKNSKWTDRSFNLIGKSRLYLKDYKNAVETFKYVNTKGQDENAKHAALINLMRLFIETKEYSNAVSVATYLRKEKLNKVNSRDLNLNKAYYFAQSGDYKKVESYIGFAIPDVKDLNQRSRLYFIIGQIRQKNGDDDGAYASYKSAVKNNPTYEIAFYSRLNMTQVSDVDNKVDAKRVVKNFEKLLKDIRNEDFKDKIYYEMARFYLKQNNTDEAISYLEKSIRASTINNKQKALSYLKLGELYYEQLKKYELAKSYYDSTINFLTPSDDEYNMAYRRQRSLENFVTQINTIHLEDSLQRFSRMDSVTLNQYLAKVEEEMAIKEEAQRKSRGNDSNNEVFSSVFDDLNTTKKPEQEVTPGSWYFYSTAAVEKGRAQFARIWGNRPLEDNWRRSKKENQASGEDETDEEANDNQVFASKNKQSGSQKAGGFDRKGFLSKIPKTDQELQASNAKIEDAYFALGKIYDQELDEPSNGIETFETLLKRFPKSEYKPEIYYYLFLLNKKIEGPKINEYKQKLASEFPNSLYNKLVNNPDYLSDSKKEEKVLSSLYSQAYSLYEIDSLNLSLKKIDSVTNVYPDNSISDKFSLLRVLVSGRKNKVMEYRQNLNLFMEKYPESDLVPYAQQLLQASQSNVFDGGSESGQIKSFEDPNSKGGLYNGDNENKQHYFAIKFNNREGIEDGFRDEIIHFNQQNFPDKDLNIEFIENDGDSKILLLKEFSNKMEAMDYHARFTTDSNLINKYNDLNLNVFIISDENFQTFNQTKDINSYMSFFKKTY